MYSTARKDTSLTTKRYPSKFQGAEGNLKDGENLEVIWNGFPNIWNLGHFVFEDYFVSPDMKKEWGVGLPWVFKLRGK